MLKLRWVHCYDEMQISKRYISRKQLLQKMKEISGEWPLLKVLIVNYPLFMSPIFYYHSSMIHLTITIGLILIWNTVFGFSLGSQLSHGWVLYFLCVHYLWSFSSSLLFSQGLQMPIFFLFPYLGLNPSTCVYVRQELYPWVTSPGKPAVCYSLLYLFHPEMLCVQMDSFSSPRFSEFLVFWLASWVPSLCFVVKSHCFET